jgi:hypothetical protein
VDNTPAPRAEANSTHLIDSSQVFLFGLPDGHHNHSC